MKLNCLNLVLFWLIALLYNFNEFIAQNNPEVYPQWFRYHFSSIGFIANWALVLAFFFKVPIDKSLFITTIVSIGFEIFDFIFFSQFDYIDMVISIIAGIIFISLVRRSN